MKLPRAPSRAVKRSNFEARFSRLVTENPGKYASVCPSVKCASSLGNSACGLKSFSAKSVELLALGAPDAQEHHSRFLLKQF